MKYGALCDASGRVDVDWAPITLPDSDEPWLEIRWRESDGPPVREASRHGFGSTLLKDALARELGGRSTLDFLPSGVHWRLRMPLPGVETYGPQ